MYRSRGHATERTCVSPVLSPATSTWGPGQDPSVIGAQLLEPFYFFIGLREMTEIQISLPESQGMALNTGCSKSVTQSTQS